MLAHMVEYTSLVMERLICIAGIVFLIALAWTLSEKRSRISWLTVCGALALQALIAALVFLAPQSQAFFLWLNNAAVKFLDLSREGTLFLFGALALSPGETTPTGLSSLGFFMAFQIFPAVIFFSALMSLLYFLRIVQPLVLLFARVFKRFMRLSGAEALASSSNIFVGIEAVFTIRPYLPRFTRSELFILLVTSMATTASTTLAIYISFLKSQIPTIAGHLISASVLAIPAAILFAKILVPETGQPETMGKIPRGQEARHSNFMAAVSEGAWEGLKLAAGIATLLIAVLGLVAILNFFLAKMGLWIGFTADLSLQKILGWAMIPFAWCLGITGAEAEPAARLLGERFILTEVISYKDMADMAAAGVLHNPRTLLVLSYALCGFAHLASLAIFVGGMSALIPSRRDEIAGLAFKALLAAFLATILTGCMAGMFYTAGNNGIMGNTF